MFDSGDDRSIVMMMVTLQCTSSGDRKQGSDLPCLKGLDSLPCIRSLSALAKPGSDGGDCEGEDDDRPEIFHKHHMLNCHLWWEYKIFPMNIIFYE